VTLEARRPDGLGDLADSLKDTATRFDAITAGAADPEGLGARMAERQSERTWAHHLDRRGPRGSSIPRTPIERSRPPASWPNGLIAR